MTTVRNKLFRKEAGLAYLLILPTFGLTFLFTIYPLITLFFKSFYTGSLLGNEHHFIGLKNYVVALENGGLHSIWITARYTIGFVILTVVIGLLIALLLNKPLKGMGIFRTVFIIPFVVPIVATAFSWLSMFNPAFGIVDRILREVGIPNIQWFNDPRAAIYTVILFSSWQYLGQNIILFLAALKTVPKNLLDAASIDGASSIRRFFSVTLPLLVPAGTIVVVLSTIRGLQTFTEIYILTRGGPLHSTSTTVFYIYQQAFKFYNTGTADALATILFLIIFFITVFQMKVLRKLGAEGYEG